MQPKKMYDNRRYAAWLDTCLFLPIVLGLGIIMAFMLTLGLFVIWMLLTM
jgi:hypothetical protein